MERLRLLIIDDEPALGDFVASVARDCGLDPILTSNNDAFRSALRSDNPDMIALDLGMPGMDGIELLRFLAEEACQVPVLIISGFDRRVLESAFRLGEALGLNMAGPVEKPVRAEELERQLQAMRERIAQ